MSTSCCMYRSPETDIPLVLGKRWGQIPHLQGGSDYPNPWELPNPVGKTTRAERMIRGTPFGVQLCRSMPSNWKARSRSHEKSGGVGDEVDAASASRLECMGSNTEYSKVHVIEAHNTESHCRANHYDHAVIG